MGWFRRRTAGLLKLHFPGRGLDPGSQGPQTRYLYEDPGYGAPGQGLPDPILIRGYIDPAPHAGVLDLWGERTTDE